MHCKMGGRSAKAVDLLKQIGIQEGPQHDGRHNGLERQGRSDRSEVLDSLRGSCYYPISWRDSKQRFAGGIR